MRYIVIFPDKPIPVYSEYFTVENIYEPGMIVIDTVNHCYYDGNKWIEIEVDHL